MAFGQELEFVLSGLKSAILKLFKLFGIFGPHLIPQAANLLSQASNLSSQAFLGSGPKVSIACKMQGRVIIRHPSIRLSNFLSNHPFILPSMPEVFLVLNNTKFLLNNMENG